MAQNSALAAEQLELVASSRSEQNSRAKRIGSRRNFRDLFPWKVQKASSLPIRVEVQHSSFRIWRKPPVLGLRVSQSRSRVSSASTRHSDDGESSRSTKKLSTRRIYATRLILQSPAILRIPAHLQFSNYEKGAAKSPVPMHPEQDRVEILPLRAPLKPHRQTIHLHRCAVSGSPQDLWKKHLHLPK